MPDKRRKDVKEILTKYKLDKYDAFELLRKSGGKLPTDSLEKDSNNEHDKHAVKNV